MDTVSQSQPGNTGTINPSNGEEVVDGLRRFSRSIVIHAPIERVFHFHDDTKNLLQITPPHIKVRIDSIGAPGLGFEALLTVRQFGFARMRWHVRITRYDAPCAMTDTQISGPFHSWTQHRFFREVEGGTELTDVVEYRLPFGVLGRLADALLVRREIAKMFAYRQAATKRLLEGRDTNT